MIETYSNFLKTINLTEDQFLKEINSYPVFYCYEDKVEIKTSNIEGVGCFTLYDFKKNEEIGTVLYGNYKTELGRYVNHSKNPNVYLKSNKFYALKNINKGEELLVNYFDNLKQLLNEQ
jgi:SET domain-containing protein